MKFKFLIIKLWQPGIRLYSQFSCSQQEYGNSLLALCIFKNNFLGAYSPQFVKQVSSAKGTWDSFTKLLIAAEFPPPELRQMGRLVGKATDFGEGFLDKPGGPSAAW